MEGCTTDFMGGVTREAVSPAVQPVSNMVREFPLPCNWHGETLEWIGTLKTALEASDTYRMVELGAGWAPWTAITGRPARMRGIEDICLRAVEGHAGNVAMARQHLRDADLPKRRPSFGEPSSAGPMASPSVPGMRR
jgi:hypothetical protein